MDQRNKDQLRNELKEAKAKLAELNEMDIDSLSDEELEEVAGGNCSDWCCANDSMDPNHP